MRCLNTPASLLSLGYNGKFQQFAGLLFNLVLGARAVLAVSHGRLDYDCPSSRKCTAEEGVGDQGEQELTEAGGQRSAAGVGLPAP